jgi:HPr kinase/phosphorylase
MKGLQVKDFFIQKQKEFSLEVLTGEIGLDKIITVSEINRPGIALSGYLEYFPYHRLQVLGNAEIFYLRTLSSQDIRKSLEKVFQYNIPCIIITRSLDIPIELIEECKKAKIALLRTSLYTTKFISEASAFLEDVFAPSIGLHGVLVDVYGLGVLILGDSGIGKSECALELLKRGHKLVADDLVTISQKVGGTLIGKAGEIIKHYMEIRGLGVIDVKTLFGVGAILDKTIIGLVIKLEEWNKEKVYDRLGIDEEFEEILDILIPKMVIPVRPGRNLAVLIEMASMNQKLKNDGYNSVKNLNEKLVAYLKQKSNNNK